jgi:hypothetical protein
VRGPYRVVTRNDLMKLELNLNRKPDGRPKECGETSRLLQRRMQWKP